MATYKLLDSYTVGAGGASSITFSNIPQTYTDLKVVVSDRTSRGGGVNDAIGLAFNGSSSNFTARRGYASNGGTASDNEPNYPVIDVASGAQANTFANIEYYIPDYTKSTYKIFMGDGAGENNSGESYRTIATSLWSQTTAITSITINYQNASGFLQNTTAYLYGIWADSSTGTPSAPTIGTASAGPAAASVEFTPAGSGNTAVTYTAISTPDSITGTGTSSPILVTGLTPSTSYTFKVAGVNPIGTGTYSAASNSISAGPATGYFHIASQTINGSSTTSVTFSNIPQFYKSLVLMVRATANTSNDFLFRLNGDSTSNAYYNQQYVSNGGGSGSGGSQDNKVGLFQYVTGWYASGLFNIDGYSFSTGYKNVRGYWGYENNSGTQILYYANALWLNENAVTSLVWTTNNGTYPITANSVFSLYGIV